MCVAGCMQVIEWCNHHKDDPPPEERSDDEDDLRTDDIDPWDQDFLEVNQATFFELTMVSLKMTFYALDLALILHWCKIG